MLLEVVGEFKTISYDRHPKNMECNYQHPHVSSPESYDRKLLHKTSFYKFNISCLSVESY